MENENPKPKVLASTDRTPLTKEINQVVNDIVIQWNNLVKNFQNTTIQLCLMVQDMLKDYPDESVKEILKKVKTHPNIKRFVSIDRIWQGLRLIKRRPELIEYNSLAEEKKEELPIEKKPYIKKDGEIFWEFYFELEKQPFSQGVTAQIEQQGKEEQWSFRQLRDHIQDTKEMMNHPGEFETRKKEKFENIKKINAIMRQLPIEKIRGILTLCQDFQKDNFEQKKEE